jgi:hypothetical protein
MIKMKDILTENEENGAPFPAEQCLLGNKYYYAKFNGVKIEPTPTDTSKTYLRKNGFNMRKKFDDLGVSVTVHIKPDGNYSINVGSYKQILSFPEDHAWTSCLQLNQQINTAISKVNAPKDKMPFNTLYSTPRTRKNPVPRSGNTISL